MCQVIEIIVNLNNLFTFNTFVYVSFVFFFFFNDTATPEIYPFSLHDALPICGDEVMRRRRDQSRHAVDEVYFRKVPRGRFAARVDHGAACLITHEWISELARREGASEDRKSTRLNSSHGYIPYAVFCLKKKTN